MRRTFRTSESQSMLSVGLSALQAMALVCPSVRPSCLSVCQTWSTP